MKVLIRKALPGDVQTIYAFICELEETRFDYDRFVEGYQPNLRQPGSIYLVGVSGNSNIVGYISAHGQFLLHHQATVFEIQEFFVAREYRGNGIGRDLLNALEKEVRITATLIEVTAQVKRKDTHQFYLRNGYEHTHFKFVKELT